MSEGHGDSPADVRSFLPRPGEPVEQYAERLRALHRDLTLVLQAVERGLAAAARPEDVGPPVPAHEPIEIVPTPVQEPAASAAPPRPARSRMPRVEVMPAPAGEERRHEQEDRRRPPAPAPEADGFARNATSDPGARAAHASPDPGARAPLTAPDPGELDARWSKDEPRPHSRLPSRPSDAAADTPEPQWIDRTADGFTAPTFPPAGPQRLTVSPWVVAGFVLAWLVVVALLVALLVS